MSRPNRMMKDVISRESRLSARALRANSTRNLLLISSLLRHRSNIRHMLVRIIAIKEVLNGQRGAARKCGGQIVCDHGIAMLTKAVCCGLAAALLAPALAAAHPFAVSGQSFRCIAEMTHSRHFYVDNLTGNLKGTVRAAQSTTCAHYPVGSVLQLMPTEATVKRKNGFNPTTPA
jgi:hypothetical protein